MGLVDTHAPQVEIFVGPFGSGKTEVVLNRALHLAAGGVQVSVIDLDLVDPFFRARQARDRLAAGGVTLVAPPAAWDDVDLPLLVPHVFAALAGPGRILIDVGGEPQGAIVLRQVGHLLPAEAPVYLVVNPYRPFMRTPDDIARTCAVIEDAAGRPVTALVSNPHLGEATTDAVIRDGHTVVVQASARLRYPIAWMAVHAALVSHVESDVPVLPLQLHMTPPWQDDRPGVLPIHRRPGPGNRGPSHA